MFGQKGHLRSMGKSLELLGLAAFNVFLALILSVTFLSNASPEKINTLTEASVEDFIHEVSKISNGERADMDPYSITAFFMNHISEDGQFISKMRYSIPDMPTDERTLEMDKMNFISHTLQSMNTMNRHETLVKVEYIKIEDEGRTATVMTTNYERGMLPVDDGFGEASLMPVQGTSYCEQKLVLNNKRVMQMAGANCTTDIVFSEGL